MESAPWMVCAACGLRHSARSDGMCPRCRSTVVAPADAPGAALRPPPPALDVAAIAPGAPLAWKVAGAAFVVNGLFGAVSSVVVHSPFAASRGVSGASGLVAILLGAGLIRGSDAARRIAIGLVAIALAAGVILVAATQTLLGGGLLALLCVPYLLLLLGEPRGGRIATASAILAGGLVLGVLGLANRGFVAGRLLAGSGAVDPTPVTRVAAGAWVLTFPPGLWYGTKQFPGSAADVAFERRFLRPDGPAYVMVYSTSVPTNRGFDMDAMANAISSATARQFDEWDVVEVVPLPGRGGTRVIHVRASLKGEKLEMLCGLFPNPPAFYDVVAGAERSAFPRLRAELQAILESFRSGP